MISDAWLGAGPQRDVAGVKSLHSAVETLMLNRNWTISVIFGTLLALAAMREKTTHIFKQQPQQVKPTQALDSSPNPLNNTTGPHFKIHFNLAKPQEMRLLPGVGERLAAELINFRDAHFPVHSADQLTQVPGIGPAKLQEISGYLDFSIVLGASPDRMAAKINAVAPQVPSHRNPDLRPAATQELVDPLP